MLARNLIDLIDTSSYNPTVSLHHTEAENKLPPPLLETLYEMVLRLMSLRGQPASLSLKQAQRQHAKTVLQVAGGRKQRAAKLLGISRSTLYNILDHEGRDGQKNEP